jgi:hypothetical protein
MAVISDSGANASISAAATTVTGTGAVMPSVRMRDPVTMIASAGDGSPVRDGVAEAS